MKEGEVWEEERGNIFSLDFQIWFLQSEMIFLKTQMTITSITKKTYVFFNEMMLSVSDSFYWVPTFPKLVVISPPKSGYVMAVFPKTIVI